MGRDVRFIVLNSDEPYGAQLRELVLQFEQAKIVAEVEEAALLGQAVRQFPVEAVLVNLDPVPDAVLPFITEVAAAEPNLAFLATSQSTDGQLILKAMRIGIREFFPKPIDHRTFGDAIQKLLAQKTDSVATGRLITVMGVSGGVGATTISANLAVELALLAKGNVALVDLDYRFGQIATLFDIEPTYTIADLSNSPERLEQSVIARALVHHSSGVHILARPFHFAQADTITAASCVGLLTSLLQFNEYVVADGPCRFDLHARSVLDIADSCLLTMQLLVPQVRSSARILEGMRDSGYHLNRVRIVCNRLGRDTGHLSVDDVAKTLSLPVSATIPDDWSAVSGSINLGEPLAVQNPKSKVRLAIHELAQSLHAQESASTEKETRKKGLIGRIFAGSAN